MNYEKNYISLTQYKQHKMAGSTYTGFVIGYGYVFQLYKILMPPNQHGYNCLVPNLHPDDSHCIPLMEYVEIRNLETIRLSVKGLFANGIATYIVQKGDTLSHIALWFEVSIADILAWNPTITNRNMILDGQKIIIKDKIKPKEKPLDEQYSKIPNSIAIKNSSHTTTAKGEVGFDNPLLKGVLYTQKTTQADAPRMFNQDIKTITNINKQNFVEVAQEFQYGDFVKAAVAFNDATKALAGISWSLSANGYFNIGWSIQLNNGWDMCQTWNISGDLDKDGTSTGIEFGIKPLGALMILVLIENPALWPVLIKYIKNQQPKRVILIK